MDGPLVANARRVLRLVHRLEDALLALALGTMILLAGARILLRNVGGGFVWSDELLRILVLWLCFLGAAVASRDGRHVTMDLLSRFLPPRLRAATRALVGLFTAAVCGALAWHSWQFVAIERSYGSIVLEGIPAWIVQAILPGGFALIAIRYAINIFAQADRALPGEADPEARP